jgi:hypothetical protein
MQEADTESRLDLAGGCRDMKLLTFLRGDREALRLKGSGDAGDRRLGRPEALVELARCEPAVIIARVWLILRFDQSL